MLINAAGRLIDLSMPGVMGIINITPDSFFSGSRHSGGTGAIETAGRMLDEGADIIDIGGFSTRPGAPMLPADEERARLIPVIRSVRREFPDAVISADTFRSEIAREAVLDAGADIINDISGGTLDDAMYRTVAELRVPYVMMHMRGTPETMQQHTGYSDVVSEIIEWFAQRIPVLLKEGIIDIIVDPGLGFAKSREQNFEILKRLNEFHMLSQPVMAGISRKSMIWQTLGTDPGGALNGTTALNMAALMNGADILRVHDVYEARQTVTLYQKLREGVG